MFSFLFMHRETLFGCSVHSHPLDTIDKIDEARKHGTHLKMMTGIRFWRNLYQCLVQAS